MEIKPKKDRQPSSNISGSPKKGGAGGKGTWGVGGLDDLKGVAFKDSKDPNYDSEEETNQEVVITPTVLTSPSEVLIQEFFASGDVAETLRGLKELNSQPNGPYFVKKALFAAMERQAAERELVSKLLIALCSGVVPPEKIEEGFQAALDSLEDVILDNPDAVETLGKFLARAVFDEVLAPAFFKHVKFKNSLAEQAVSLANGFLNQPFRSERLQHVWGPGALTSLKRVKEEVKLMFEEFLINGNSHDAAQTVRELNAHFYHPQLVKQGLTLALGKTNESDRKKVLTLLSLFDKEGLISKDHMKEGFTLTFQALDDLKLDYVNAPSLLQSFVTAAKAEGWLDLNFEENKKV